MSVKEKGKIIMKKLLVLSIFATKDKEVWRGKIQKE